MVDFFNRAIEAGDALSAGSTFGFLYDLMETAKTYAAGRQDKYSWQRIHEYLNEEIDKILEEAKEYPMPIQQALMAKIILYGRSNS